MAVYSLLFIQDGLFEGPGNTTQYSNYSVQILGLLFVSLLLGYLLRYFIAAKWKILAKSLEIDVDDLKKRNNALNMDIQTAKYEKEKINEELKSTKSKYGDSIIKIKALEEQIQELQSKT